MTVTIRRKSKAEKGGTLTLRISMKDKFALELLAQSQSKTLSSIVMEALQKPLKDGLTVQNGEGKRKKMVYIPDVVYDPLEPDRIVKLAMSAHDLLTDRQKVIWTVIKQNPAFLSDGSPNFKAIRDKWESIQTETDNLLDQHSN